MNSESQNIPLVTNTGTGMYEMHFKKINPTQICANCPFPGTARVSTQERPGAAKT